MHFFIDPTRLKSQAAANAFGPITGQEINKFQIGSTHEIDAGADARVFACQDSMMIVQQCIDETTNTPVPNKVNLILKPIKPIEIKHTQIKYYVYRGLDFGSLLVSDTEVAADTPATRTEFIKNFWANWTKYLTAKGLPLTTQPSPKSFGYSTGITDPYVEELFNSAESNDTNINDYQAIKVAEGEWIASIKAGNFISFEIITETDHFEFKKGPVADPGDFKLDLKYVQKSTFEIDTTGLAESTDAEKFIRKSKKEKILNYADPAAFFGMHTMTGVKLTVFTPTSTNSLAGKVATPKKKKELYNQILTKFANPNRVYLDIRSEKGYSYNFYGNYASADTNHIILKVTRTAGTTTTTTDIAYNNWPILWLDAYSGNVAVTDYNSIEIQLRVDDNEMPLLFFENTFLKGEKAKDNFVKETDLLVVNDTAWTKKIRLQFPNFNPTTTTTTPKLDVAYIIKLHYLRQKAHPPGTDPNDPTQFILQMNSYLDSAFGSIPIPELAVQTKFGHYAFTRRNLVKGSNFAYMGDSGVYQDSSAVMFYVDNTFTLKSSTTDFAKLDIKASEYNPIMESPTFRKELIYNKWQATHATDGTINLIEVVGYNKAKKKTTPVEDILLLGLTKTELAILDGLGSFSDKHRKYLVFTEDTPRKDITTNTPYKKYLLSVQGMDANGKRQVVVSTIAVFGTSTTLLCSKDFANLTTITNFFPDPGTYTEYDFFHRISYDKSHPIVTSYSALAGGYITPTDNKSSYLGVTADLKTELKGDLFYPVDESGSSVISTRETSYPLIVITHGNGHDYLDYENKGGLCSFLAKNGFIVVSLNGKFLKGSMKLAGISPLPDFPGYTHIAYFDGNIYLYKNTSTPVLAKLEENPTPPPPVIAKPVTWVKGTDYNVDAGVTKITFEGSAFPNGDGMGTLARSKIIYAHLRLLKNHFGSSIANNIGLYGHSRGGEAVVRAAKDIATLTSTTVPNDLKIVKAVMSLAPTDLWEKESLTQAIPYFVLYGSKDGDVSGITSDQRNAASTERTGTGAFSQFDRASNSTEKTMLFVKAGTHNGFITDNHDYPFDSSPASYIDQRAVNKAYTNAFFRTNLKGESIWRTYLQGKQIPKSLLLKDLYIQHRNMTAPSVIGSFNGITSGDFATLVTAGTGATVAKTEFDKRGTSPAYNNTSRKDPYSPHFNDGLYVEYAHAGATVTINVPSAKKDISSFQFLSFRIAHVAGKFDDVTLGTVSLSTTYNDLSNLKIQLIDGDDLVSDYILQQSLPIPDKRINKVIGSGASKQEDKEEFTKSAMITVRIPISSYTGIALTNITKINFIVPAVTVDGRIVIDDIELTN
jgi:hypothetical protein